VRGAYAITEVDAKGCGDSVGIAATQCIRQTACGITFVSPTLSNGRSGINGTAAIQSTGDFTGAALTEGIVARTGCTGVWDAATATMTVDCGGTAVTQACVIALKRSGVCPLP
jgi:hypothetical protein